MKDVWSQVRIKGKTPDTVVAAPALPETQTVNTVTEDDVASCWACPVCQAPLALRQGTYQCKNQHSFDRAKEGYINLLLANKKHSADPGDNKSMLLGRRAFLERGFYQTLADKLAGLITEQFGDTSELSILDAGCGEGYYLGRLAEQLPEGYRYIGTDISRTAMRMAAKRHKGMDFAVASSYELPLADQSVDVLLRVFAPLPESEVVRVLKPGGLYLWAHPGEQHLFELRSLIYDQPQLHSVADDQPESNNLLWQDVETVNYPLHLPDSEAIKGLLAMTPYYWTASEEKQAHCEALPELDLQADFRISVYTKRPDE